MQRIPLELGLQLNINRLISDGLIQPGKVTRLSRFYWLNDEGDERASARIEADITEPSADNARNGTMRIRADWINQTIRLVGCPPSFWWVAVVFAGGWRLRAWEQISELNA